MTFSEAKDKGYSLPRNSWKRLQKRLNARGISDYNFREAKIAFASIK